MRPPLFLLIPPLAIAASAIAFTPPALGDTPTINTHAGWDGASVVGGFGCPDTSVYGQTITVPTGLHHLNEFEFWWKYFEGSGGSMVVRAYVYKWDGTKAKGNALYESPPRTISFSDAAFHDESFTPEIVVNPGVQYVMFVSIDREYVDCKNAYELIWGAVADTAYAGGTFVYQNNAGDDLQWATSNWATAAGFDTVFKAFLSP